MMTMSSFIKNPKNINYEGEDNDEQIIYVIRRSHWTNVGWLFMLLIMIIIPIVLSPYLNVLASIFGPGFTFGILLSWCLSIFGIALFKLLNWFFNVYIVSNKKIVDFDFHGLTYKNISDTPVTNIEDVTAKINGPINMILNIGDVFIQTAAEHREFDFHSVDDPGKLRDVLSDMAAEAQVK